MPLTDSFGLQQYKVQHSGANVCRYRCRNRPQRKACTQKLTLVRLLFAVLVSNTHRCCSSCICVPDELTYTAMHLPALVLVPIMAGTPSIRSWATSEPSTHRDSEMEKAGRTTRKVTYVTAPVEARQTPSLRNAVFRTTRGAALTQGAVLTRSTAIVCTIAQSEPLPAYAPPLFLSSRPKKLAKASTS